MIQTGPILPLYDYQNAFIGDKSRLKGLVKGRQIGGSHIGTLEVVLDMVEKGSSWNMMSRTARQAKRLLRKLVMHVQAIDLYVTKHLQQPSIIKNISTEEVVLSAGQVCSAVPCDADTTVGDTVNWLLDEFALYPDSHRTFSVIKPSIMRGKRIVAISTPRGRQNKFAELYDRFVQDGAQSGWSFHKITIEDAMRGGLEITDHFDKPVSYEQFRAQEIRDMGLEMWNQEYMCSFHDLVAALVGYDVIDRCSIIERPGDRTEISPSQVYARSHQIPIYVGIDFGRFRDATVMWFIAKHPDGRFETIGAIKLGKTDTPDQAAIMREFLRTGRITRVCIDYMGNGTGLYDILSKEFPGEVEKVALTNMSKMEMAQKLLLEMQSGNFVMIKNEEIEEDFASIDKVALPSGNIRLEARPGSKTHGDYFWAACLSVLASRFYGDLDEIPMASAA